MNNSELTNTIMSEDEKIKLMSALIETQAELKQNYFQLLTKNRQPISKKDVAIEYGLVTPTHIARGKKDNSYYYLITFKENPNVYTYLPNDLAKVYDRLFEKGAELLILNEMLEIEPYQIRFELKAWEEKDTKIKHEYVSGTVIEFPFN